MMMGVPLPLCFEVYSWTRYGSGTATSSATWYSRGLLASVGEHQLELHGKTPKYESMAAMEWVECYVVETSFTLNRHVSVNTKKLVQRSKVRVNAHVFSLLTLNALNICSRANNEPEPSLTDSSSLLSWRIRKAVGNFCLLFCRCSQ